jgi:hypothetical protein
VDIEHETWKLKAFLVVVVLFFISMYFSCEELKYATNAKTAEATIDDVVTEPARRGSVRVMRYHYTNDSGEKWNASYRVSNDYVPPADRKLPVEYIGSGSRPAGVRNYGSLVFFFSCLIALAVGGTMFVLHVRRETSATRSAPRSPWKKV